MTELLYHQAIFQEQNIPEVKNEVWQDRVNFSEIKFDILPKVNFPAVPPIQKVSFLFRSY